MRIPSLRIASLVLSAVLALAAAVGLTAPAHAQAGGSQANGPITITHTTRHAVDPRVCAALIKADPSLQAELKREGGCFSSTTSEVIYPTAAAYQAATQRARLSTGSTTVSPMYTCTNESTITYNNYSTGPLQTYQVKSSAVVALTGCNRPYVWSGEHWCTVVYTTWTTSVNESACYDYPSSSDLSLYVIGQYWVVQLGGFGYTETQYTHVQPDGNYTMWGDPYS